MAWRPREPATTRWGSASRSASAASADQIHAPTLASPRRLGEAAAMAGGTAQPYRWTFYRSGGVDQVALQTGDDLVHLRELDPKLWIALSMPTRGVDIDTRTLDLLDTDKDGHIRHPEVLAAVAWVCEQYREPARLLIGGDAVALDDLREGALRSGPRRQIGRA